MWTVKYKPNNDSQPWLTLESYDNKSQAVLHAARVSSRYYKVSVIDSEYKTIWKHEN